ncbi:hypothetical protein HDU83_002334 [Entophlyctis luteolus]|nr:hypothetical protein HDU83_002334 [Entophlyctis luteolus]KAJ3388627.1 hypothetical protein HDU84_009633 [Entophlyctis sp. JEL0112]
MPATGSVELLAAIKAHVTSESATAERAGLMLEIVDPESPLFNSSQQQQPVQVFLSYSGHYFRESLFAIAPSGVQDGSTLVEVLDFVDYDAVVATTTKLLASELLAIHKPKIVLCLGKQIHSAKLAQAFGLEYVNASELAASASNSENIPDVVDLLHTVVRNSQNTRGILIDGFPKNVQDAQEFEKRVDSITAVLNFNPGFDTNNSVSAIKRRLFGGNDNLLEVPRPLAQYFGARVIPVNATSNSEEDVFQSAWKRLFDAKIFSPDQNIVVAICKLFALFLFAYAKTANGEYPAESNLLCSQLSTAHNLALVRLGAAQGQSEPLVVKLAKTQAELAQSRERLGQLEKAVEIFSAAAQGAPPSSATATVATMVAEIENLNDRISALNLENQAETLEKNVLRQQTEFLKNSLIFSEDQYTSETKLLLEENDKRQSQITELNAQLASLQETHEKLKSHATNLQSLLDKAIRERDGLEQRNGELEANLSQTKTLHSDLTVSHELLEKNHKELQDKHLAAELELLNRTVFYEAQVNKLKSEANSARKNKEEAIATMMEIQSQSVSMNSRIVELEVLTQTLSFQLARATEKYKKSKAKELEDEVSRLEQVVASLTAEAQFLKSLLKSSNDVQGGVREMRSGSYLKRSWIQKQ